MRVDPLEGRFFKFEKSKLCSLKVSGFFAARLFCSSPTKVLK
jgi:hypothetical protein